MSQIAWLAGDIAFQSMFGYPCVPCLLETPLGEFTNGYRIIVLRLRHFIIALNRSDRLYFNSDHAAPPQLYRGNLSHYHWPDRPIQPVRTVLGITATLRSPYPPNAPHSEKFRSPKRTNSSKI